MISRAKSGLTLVPAGLVLSIFGMLCYTGILDISVPSVIMYAGFVLTIAGLVFLYLDLKANESILIKYEEELESERCSVSAGKSHDSERRRNPPKKH